MTIPHAAVPRRLVVAGAAGAAALPLVLPPTRAAADPRGVTRSAARFLHGVASGDPLPTSVVLWTRVTPTAAATPGSGIGPRVAVVWEVSTDRRFRSVARRGVVHTSAARDHTVKVDATGLRPATAYYYRFSLGGVRSPIGRTKTAPASDATPEGLRFGVVSCSNYPVGYFGAYRHLASR
ncbi:MAG: alkaline phosphatase, partial [Actinobacteria bacterium]|nr:alkaline phosphatase [Actinomycetota bacterium]